MLTNAAIEPIIPVQRIKPLEQLWLFTVLESAARLVRKTGMNRLRGQIAELTPDGCYCYYLNLIGRGNKREFEISRQR